MGGFLAMTPSRSLLSLLAQRALNGQAQRAVEEALGRSWAYPADPSSLQGAWRSFAPPRGPVPGAVALVTVSRNPDASEGEGRVFYLDPSARPHGTRFSDRARALWDEMGLLAERLASVHAYPDERHAAIDRAAPMFKFGAGASELDGASFALAFLLARVSSLTGHGVPSSILATATVEDDGDHSMGAVEGLEAKLDAIAHTALGVTHVLVSKRDEDRARALARTMPRPLEIVGVPNARSALEYVFGARFGEAPERWREREGRDASLQQLARYVLSAHARSWSSVVHTLDLLSQAQSRDGERPSVGTLEAVARRHAGTANAGAIALDWDDAVVDRVGMAYVAQVVQSAADAGDDRCRAFVERALAMANEARAEPGAIQLRGACARALAAMRDYDRAEREAREAALRWIARDEPSQCSYALCEWIRVAGVLGRRASLEEAIPHATRLLRDERAGPYIALALTSAFVRSEQYERALEAVPREAAQGYVHRAHRRWVARALQALGRCEGARAIRDALREARSDRPGESKEVCVESLLADLDDALEARDEARALALVEALDARGLQATRWLVEGTRGLERARRIADEYPY